MLSNFNLFHNVYDKPAINTYLFVGGKGCAKSFSYKRSPKDKRARRYYLRLCLSFLFYIIIASFCFALSVEAIEEYRPENDLELRTSFVAIELAEKTMDDVVMIYMMKYLGTTDGLYRRELFCAHCTM